MAKSLDLVAVATTDRPTDDVLAEFCTRIGAPCFRGSEEDVLDRYWRAAATFRADVIVRLTADCPLLDSKVINEVVGQYRTGSYDYVSNSVQRTYPDGLDTEVFHRGALERAWREAQLRSEREHVTPYIWKHPELFRLGVVGNDCDLSALRWTVDEPEDLEFVTAVYRHFGPRVDFGLKEILGYLDEHSELKDLNARFECNEGYEKSLREDGITARNER